MCRLLALAPLCLALAAVRASDVTDVSADSTSNMAPSAPSPAREVPPRRAPIVGVDLWLTSTPAETRRAAEQPAGAVVHAYVCPCMHACANAVRAREPPPSAALRCAALRE